MLHPKNMTAFANRLVSETKWLLAVIRVNKRYTCKQGSA
jgi:hypothetical protein